MRVGGESSPGVKNTAKGVKVFQVLLSRFAACDEEFGQADVPCVVTCFHDRESLIHFGKDILSQNGNRFESAFQG